MKILVLAEDTLTNSQAAIFLGLRKAIGSIDIRRLSEDQQLNLKNFYQNLKTKDKFDRILLFLNFNLIRGQRRFLEKLPGLIFYDQMSVLSADGDHNEYKQHLNFYKSIPWARVIVSNYFIAEKFYHSGVDSYFLAKGFYEKKYFPLKDSNAKKYSLAFCTSSKYPYYRKNISFVERIKNTYQYAYEIVRRDDNYGYINLNTFNRVICADYNLCSYPDEIYEVLASGCLAFTLDRGKKINQKLGFVPMGNIVLFTSLKDLKEKYQQIDQNPKLAKEITQAGMNLAHRYFGSLQIGAQLATFIEYPTRDPKEYSSSIRIFGFKL